MHRKEQQRQRRLLRSLTALVLVAGAARGEEQKIVDDDASVPPLTVPQLRYLKIDAEAEQINDHFGISSGGTSSRTQRIYFAPGAGIGWDYYLYHPNLLTFQLLAEPGYSWQELDIDGHSSAQDSLQLNGSFTGTLLPLKPYSSAINYSRSHGEYHYDFFNSATVDTETYGASSGYRQGAVPFTVSYQHTLTDSTGLSYNSTVKQTTVNLHAQNERQNGNNTDLSYQFTLYDGNYFNDVSSFASSEATHSLTITDAERLTDRIGLISTLYYNRYESQGIDSDNPTVMLDLSWQHTPHLRSFYSVSSSDYSSGGANSLNSTARVGIQHQLYESLTSIFDVHGSDSRTEGYGSQQQSDTLGATLSENYTKRLSNWGNLFINNSTSYDFTQQSGNGGAIAIYQESHTVTASGLLQTPLTLPRVITLTRVAYLDGITPVSLTTSDYNILTVGELTQIQLTPSGQAKLSTAAPPATSVQVDYVAQSNPDGNYSTFNNQTEIRLSFCQQHASIYARYNFTENQTSTTGFVLDNYQEFQAGADYNWQKLRLNGVYTDRESTIYSYQSMTLSEGYTLFTTFRHSASLDFHQQWNSFNNVGVSSATSDLAYYSFTGHYEWHLSSRLNWRNEAGCELQRGTGSDRDYFVARSYFSWFVGKLDLNLGYEHENQKYTADDRDRDFAFLRMRRNF